MFQLQVTQPSNTDDNDYIELDEEQSVEHTPRPVIVPTDEQEAAIALVESNHRVKLNAYAGCSKTTTLSLVADKQCVPSLYLAYNKAMAVEARDKFPSWVTVKTTHALAYAVFGRQLQAKLKRPAGAYQNVCGTGGEIARFFKMEAFESTAFDKKVLAAGMGLAVRETVNRFEYSAAMELNRDHVSFGPLAKITKKVDAYDEARYVRIVLDTAKKLWALRTNLRSNILATHDTYLKLYQLAKPDLSSYEIIYLDEGQDTNDCVLDIISNQSEPKIVMVGDGYQQIYSWRGSVNAMKKLDYVEGRLTQSFRFGQAVADIANLILSNVDGERQTDIRGWEKLDSKVYSFEDSYDLQSCYTMLYRTNMTLVLDAVELIAEGKSVNLEIDVSDFVKLLDSAVELKAGNMKGVKHEEVLPYASWKDFCDEVAGTGGELGRVHQIIDSGRVYHVMGMLSKQRNCENPDVILTTAHKSKGREWDTVVLADDFPSGYNKDGQWVGLTEMEQNLLYVAATRAKKALYVNSTIRQMQARQKAVSEEGK